MRPFLVLSSFLLLAAGCSERASTIETSQPTDRGGLTPAPAVAAGAVQTSAPAGPSSASELAAAPLAPAGEDILALAHELHSEAYAQPPTVFRSGHVTPTTLPASALKRRADGFEVRLPSGAPIATPAVYDGLVFVPGGFRSKELYAIDAITGEPRWGLHLDDDGPSTPACDDGVCAINTESCTIFVVDAKTGKLLWSKWLGDPLVSAPTIAGGRVFTAYPVPAGNTVGGKPRPKGVTHALAAFALRTGEILWQRWLDADVMSAPVASGSALLVTSFAGTYYDFDQATGAVRVARKVRATSAPVVAGGDVWFTKRTDAAGAPVAREAVGRASQESFEGNPKAAPYIDRHVQASSQLATDGVHNDTANGFGGGAPGAANPQAALMNVGQNSVYTMQAHQGSRVLSLAAGNVNTMGDEVVCTSPRTGETRWSFKLEGDLAGSGGFLAAPPAAAGDRIVVATLGGDVLVLDPNTGKVDRRWRLGAPVRSQPVIDAGWIYVGTSDGRLIGLDTQDTRLSGWPQWGANAQRTGVL